MSATRKDDERQLLRPRPGENSGEWHDVVFLAVDDDRVGRHARDREALNGGSDKNQALGGNRCRDARLHEGSEREACERNRQLAEAGARMRERSERVVGLADAFVERAFRGSDTTKIETRRDVVHRKERLREGLRDLVVERAALQRMRMRDERDAARRPFRHVQHEFERSRRAGDREALGRSGRQMRSLSTISPPMMCRSMISSMSWRST